MIKPYYEENGITIYHGDCREILPELEPVDLVLTDPPYGVNLNTDNSRFSGGTAGNIAKRGNGPGTGAGEKIVNDNIEFNPAFLTRYGKHQIIWGWNNYPDKLPRGACLVWLKRNDEAFGSFLSDAETAWKSNGYGVYCKRDLSNNAIALQRVHPTQKPISLYEWTLYKFAKPGQRILDTHLGSGSSAIAAHYFGCDFVGCEIDVDYFNAAKERFDRETRQVAMF